MPSVTIHRADCTSCSTCRSTCPVVFEEDPDDGMSGIVEQFRTSGDKAAGDIPPEHEACAQEAADICPVSIITVAGDKRVPVLAGKNGQCNSGECTLG